MDTSVIVNNYMGMGPTEVVVDYLLRLKLRCRYYNGDYVLLWQNQRFVDQKERGFYRTVIGYCGQTNRQVSPVSGSIFFG